MKRVLLMMAMCVMVQVMPVSAQELNEVPTVSENDAAIQTVTVPDVVGMAEADAVAALEAVVLPDGTAVEIIKNYAYSAEAEVDTVYEQSVSGEVSAEQAKQVTIAVSMGVEPKEVLTDVVVKENVPVNNFGIAAFADPSENTTGSMFGVDWESVPSSYEYPFDNSANCWYFGSWYDADQDGEVECYKTPEGTYDNNVRNLIQLYCDGQYVYLHVKMATIYEYKFNGEDYQFYVDGNMAAFQVEYAGGGTITGNIDSAEFGTQEVEVRHRVSSMSYEVVPGAQAYLTRYDNDLNAELELRIPMSELQRQNRSVDIGNVGTIEFFSPNLMHNRVTIAGASTFPFALAGAALVLIPGSTLLINKKFGKKNKKDSNE